jgi:hypothetical protein
MRPCPQGIVPLGVKALSNGVFGQGGLDNEGGTGTTMTVATSSTFTGNQAVGGSGGRP